MLRNQQRTKQHCFYSLPVLLHTGYSGGILQYAAMDLGRWERIADASINNNVSVIHLQCLYCMALNNCRRRGEWLSQGLDKPWQYLLAVRY